MELNHLKKIEFYDGSELLSRSQYDIFFSLGGRNIGKSTFFQKFIFRDFIKKNKLFGIIVKYEDDLSTFAANYFSQFWMDKWYSDYEMLYKRGKYYTRKKSDKKNIKDTKTGWKLCGYAIALNKNASIKSTTTYQDIDNLLFEEFMPLEDRYIGSAKDPYKEPKLLQSVYQSIARGEKGKRTRRVRLICISNNYTMNNPYFNYFGILNMVTTNPNSIYQRFYTYDKGNLHYALEFSQLKPESTGIETDDESYGIQFRDYRNELKTTKDKPKRPFMQFTFDNKYYVSIANYNDSLIAYQTKITNDPNNVLVYSCANYKTKEAMSMSSCKNSDLYRIIKNVYDKNIMYYDKLETFIQLTNILAW